MMLLKYLVLGILKVRILIELYLFRNSIESIKTFFAHGRNFSEPSRLVNYCPDTIIKQITTISRLPLKLRDKQVSLLGKVSGTASSTDFKNVLLIAFNCIAKN
jgi:hypothetical protein